jgi:hypothetical protein
MRGEITTRLRGHIFLDRGESLRQHALEQREQAACFPGWQCDRLAHRSQRHDELREGGEGRLWCLRRDAAQRILEQP